MEGTSNGGRAIPIRRTRGGRGGAAKAAPAAPWLGGIESLWGVIEPGRQLWLASLGATSFAARGARALWFSMVAEGAVLESRIRGALPTSGKARASG